MSNTIDTIDAVDNTHDSDHIGSPVDTPDDSASDFVLRGDHITLDALLKAAGWVSSGGAAKPVIAGGAVQVNGAVDTRRGRKLRAGDTVVLAGARLRIVAAEAAEAAEVAGTADAADAADPSGAATP